MKADRYVWCDVVRVFAIITAVICHSTERVYSGNLSELFHSASRISWFFRTIAFTLGRIGVPIFLLLTGFLLLKRPALDDVQLKKHFKCNWIPLLVTTEAWILIYQVYLHISNRRPFDFLAYIKEALFLTTTPLSHMWYMPMIIGVYIAIPFVSLLLATYRTKLLYIPFLLGAIHGVILPTINSHIQIYNIEGQTLPLALNVAYFGSTYGTYIICGYLVGEKKY
ncbi:acyltransferase family protein [bacterium 210820-DFI.6.52]|nr:acyltransferase family protein [bacterium 210820-DFI.6.52]